MGLRKGILFSIAALIVAGIIITTVFVVQSQKTQEKLIEDNVRVILVNSYMTSLLDFSSEALRSASVQALNNFSTYARTNPFSTQQLFENAFALCILNNSLGNQHCMATNVTFLNMTRAFINVTQNNLGIETSMNIVNFQVYEIKPFEVVVNATADISVEDISANWTLQNQDIVAVIDVTGINDPAFEQLGTSRKIKRTTIKQWNSETLYGFIENETYRSATGIAPSFLGRFVDASNYEASNCCGIESMVWYGSLSVNNPANKSWTDWQLAKGITFGCGLIGNTVLPDVDDPGSRSMFLDIAHWNRYGVEDYFVNECG